MAEAEDVITDAARHATIFARDLWRRHRRAATKGQAPPLLLADVAPRLDLLLTAVFGRAFPIRAAQPGAPPTVLARLLLRRERAPHWRDAIGATDGAAIWLPPTLTDVPSEPAAVARWRTLALRQAMRAVRLGDDGSFGGTGGANTRSSGRGSAATDAMGHSGDQAAGRSAERANVVAAARTAASAREAAPVIVQVAASSPLARDLYLLFESHAADAALLRLLPGLRGALRELRAEALARRPPIGTFPARLRGFEQMVRAVLDGEPERWTDLDEPLGGDLRCFVEAASDGAPRIASADALALALALALAWPDADAAARLAGPWLWRDQWSGDLRLGAAGSSAAYSAKGGVPADQEAADDDGPVPRSARLARRPEVREKSDDEEDDQSPGAWMVQTAAPHETAEDPMGLSRPTDRDAETAAEDFADALSELPEARLVSAPGRPKEVLLSDDPPEPRASQRQQEQQQQQTAGAPVRIDYPEWDWKSGSYRDPGATVWLLPAPPGPRQWVERTLAARQGMLHEIRRRFELLRAQRTRLYRQLDGDAIDLSAYVDARAQFDAGLPLDDRLYSGERRSRRDLAVLLLVDVSGSTDSQIGANQRIIDVEREALLLVCIALEGMCAPYSVQAFSGEGPRRVVVRSVKSFSEKYGDAVAQRIAGLEPERYTRAGAALRHATALLMREAAEHRLLLLLSDGKPNDNDEYEGRYGVEDLRQAVAEARLQGIAPFCLTIDRQAASYLPSVFGPHHHALLQRPERLPDVLLDWLRRLVAG